MISRHDILKLGGSGVAGPLRPKGARSGAKTPADFHTLSDEALYRGLQIPHEVVRPVKARAPP